MAKDPSFDIVSEVDMQVIDDCVNVALKEINNRFDFKGQNITIELNKGEKTITINAPADFVLNQVRDILFQKFIKRGLNQKCLREKKKEKAAGDSVREINEVVSGIDKDLAKVIVKDMYELESVIDSIKTINRMDGITFQIDIYVENLTKLSKFMNDISNIKYIKNLKMIILCLYQGMLILIKALIDFISMKEL